VPAGASRNDGETANNRRSKAGCATQSHPPILPGRRALRHHADGSYALVSGRSSRVTSHVSATTSTTLPFSITTQ
jgi:hypothetical protein